MDVTIIPESAWVQAVFVVLFIVFVAGLLHWFSRQQEKWQDFINSRDANWQDWMTKGESRTSAHLENVAKALENLAQKIDDHDNKVDDRINGINNIKPLKQRKQVIRRNG